MCFNLVIHISDPDKDNNFSMEEYEGGGGRRSKKGKVKFSRIGLHTNEPMLDLFVVSNNWKTNALASPRAAYIDMAKSL